MKQNQTTQLLPMMQKSKQKQDMKIFNFRVKILQNDVRYSYNERLINFEPISVNALSKG